MNALNVDKGEQVGAPDAVGLIDCGCASERTQGFIYLVLFELGIPPFNTTLPV